MYSIYETKHMAQIMNDDTSSQIELRCQNMLIRFSDADQWWGVPKYIRDGDLSKYVGPKHLKYLARNRNIHDYTMYEVACELSAHDVPALNLFCEQMRETRPLVYVFNNAAKLSLPEMYIAVLDLANLHHVTPFRPNVESVLTRCFYGADKSWGDDSRFTVCLHNTSGCALLAFINQTMPTYDENIREWTSAQIAVLNIFRTRYPQYLDHLDYCSHDEYNRIPGAITGVYPSYFIDRFTFPDERRLILAHYGKSPPIINCIYNLFLPNCDLVAAIRDELYDGAGDISLIKIVADYPRFLYHEQIIGHLLDKKYWCAIAEILFKCHDLLDRMNDVIAISAENIAEISNDTKDAIVYTYGRFVKWYKTWALLRTKCAIMMITKGATECFGEDIAALLIARYKSMRRVRECDWLKELWEY
jgi:hypothetical protein